jgi:hypothetical protein
MGQTVEIILQTHKNVARSRVDAKRGAAGLTIRANMHSSMCLSHIQDKSIKSDISI